MLRSANKNSILNKFSFWLRRGLGSPKVAIHNPMILSFYSTNDSTQFPERLLVNQQIIYTSKKTGRQTIDLNSLHIRIPNGGMYVAFEYIIDDKYQCPMRFIETAKGIDTVQMFHAANFDGIYSKGFNLPFYSYKLNTWTIGDKRGKPTLIQVHGTLKFEAEIKYCASKQDQKNFVIMTVLP